MKAFASSRDNDDVAFTLRRNVARSCDAPNCAQLRTSVTIAFYKVGNLVAALIVETDMHGVGVAKQVVQIAQDLLVQPRQEDAKDIVLAIPELMQLKAGATFLSPHESVDLAIESQVTSCNVPRRSGSSVKPVDGHDGNS
ncbi:MAG: hypothetical protein IPP90_20920 [Gemmatimonadaceae bacterium]|nr:hypothetical protein [Gemmatimonadaceae bacterium]